MSVVTKSGDGGTTALMYGRRVSKCHPRMKAIGAVDELNAALGMARATVTDNFIRDNLLAIQKDLIVLMGELAVAPQDLPRYVKDGFPIVPPEMTARLDLLVRKIKLKDTGSKKWAIPGATLDSAALDVARTICRRAERQVCALKESGNLKNMAILACLNRLSKLLWLFARRAEAKSNRPKNR